MSSTLSLTPAIQVARVLVRLEHLKIQRRRIAVLKHFAGRALAPWTVVGFGVAFNAKTVPTLHGGAPKITFPELEAVVVTQPGNLTLLCPLVFAKLSRV